MYLMQEEMLVRMALLFVILTSVSAEERTCYKCRVKNQCQILDPMSVEKCRPDVQHCIKKITLSKVTGASVTERYCGGRDFLDISSDLVENKCYTGDTHSRTKATVCYCSSDYCNSGHLSGLLASMLLSSLMTVFLL